MKEQKDNETIDYCVNLLNEIIKMDHKIKQLESIINTALEYGKVSLQNYKKRDRKSIEEGIDFDLIELLELIHNNYIIILEGKGEQ